MTNGRGEQIANTESLVRSHALVPTLKPMENLPMWSPTEFATREKELEQRMKAARAVKDDVEMQQILGDMTKLFAQQYPRHSEKQVEQ